MGLFRKALLSKTKESFYIRGWILIVIGFLLVRSGKLAPIYFLINLLTIASGIFSLLVANKFDSQLDEEESQFSQDFELDNQYESLLESENELSQDFELSDYSKSLIEVDDRVEDSRHIYTDGGNYNESISGNYVQGDYVEVQTYQINFNQDLQGATNQLQEILTSLHQQGISERDSQRRVIDDLTRQVSGNPRLANNLIRLRRSLGKSERGSYRADVEEANAVEDVVKHAFSLLSHNLNEPILVVQGRYKKLYEFLKAKDWENADLETVKVIFKLCDREPKAYTWLSSRDVACIPRKDIHIINSLWVKFSNGRFGFSVQKRIWREVTEDRCKFGSRVGWRVDEDWIFYADLIYSSRAPIGHFPVAVMLSSLAWNSTSCDPNYSLLNTFYSRQYNL